MSAGNPGQKVYVYAVFSSLTNRCDRARSQRLRHRTKKKQSPCSGLSAPKSHIAFRLGVLQGAPFRGFKFWDRKRLILLQDFQLSNNRTALRQSPQLYSEPLWTVLGQRNSQKKSFETIALWVGFSAGNPPNIGTFTAWNRTRNCTRTLPESLWVLWGPNDYTNNFKTILSCNRCACNRKTNSQTINVCNWHVHRKHLMKAPNCTKEFLPENPV